MSDYDEKSLGQDAAAIVQSFIDEKLLEKWQKHFSSVANVFLRCFRAGFKYKTHVIVQKISEA